MAEWTGTRLTGPAGVSLALHATLAAFVFFAFRKGTPEALPPIYKVNIIAAPAGPRAIGVVQPEAVETPAVKTPTVVPPAPPAPKESPLPTPKITPAKPVAKATPVERPAAATPKMPAPKAGGGPIGG